VDGGETFSAEAWVDVPTARLAIDRVTVSGAHANVTFTLPRAGSATVECVDVAGRRIGRRELDGLAPGSHAVNVEAPAGSGVWFLRLTQGTAHTTRRIATLR
jgi:hypothetical protein